MVFRESLTLVAIGLAIGLPVVAAVSRLIGTMLFEVSPTDPATVAAAMLVLLVVGASSGYLPAWRASRVDPLTALETTRRSGLKGYGLERVRSSAQSAIPSLLRERDRQQQRALRSHPRIRRIERFVQRVRSACRGRRRQP